MEEEFQTNMINYPAINIKTHDSDIIVTVFLHRTILIEDTHVHEQSFGGAGAINNK